MTEDMLHKMTRAYRAHELGLDCWDDISPKAQDSYVNHMRAAVAVQREPNEAMKDAIRGYTGNIDGLIGAMIDAMEGE